jgi:hypothetical protein
MMCMPKNNEFMSFNYENNALTVFFAILDNDTSEFMGIKQVQKPSLR